MRKLKFRAWDETEKHFWYFTLQEILERRMSYRGSWDEKILKGKKTQHTGLNDKKGIEIYEGDIVLYGNKKYLIKCDNYKFYAEGFYESFQDDPCDIFSENAYMVCEVIGNVYENPELINL